MPPMPPGIAGAGVSFFGSSATIASVVMRSPATEEAPCSAWRTTLVGSMMPFFTKSAYSASWASNPKAYWSFSRILPTMTEPSSPELMAIWRAGAESALRTISTPCFWSSFCVRTRRMHRVVDAILALLHLDLGGAADADHRDAARELGKPLLQLLAVVVGGGLLDLRLDLGDAVLDVLLLAGAVDNRGVLLIDHHFLGAAEHVQRDVLELDAEILADRGAAGQDSDVL